MLETCKGFGYIIGHGKVYCLMWVVPLEMDSAENCTVFVDGGIVVLLQGIDQMSGMAVANKFDSEVINYKVEDDRACGVAKESRGVPGRVVAIVG